MRVFCMAFLPCGAVALPRLTLSVTRDRRQRKAGAATTIPFDSEAATVRRLHRSNSLLIWVVIFAVLAVVAHYMQAPRRAPGEPVTGRAHVIDGDSLAIAGVRIRLHGIDAPEREQDCRDAGGKTYACGHAAMRALITAINGRSVTCTPVEVDQYNRDVATCAVDGADLGEIMVRGGHALDYARHSRGRYAAAEREARAARRGLWAGTFETPATWRQQNATR
jgi:endonuclease YncB( thermonuclease family)